MEKKLQILHDGSAECSCEGVKKSFQAKLGFAFAEEKKSKRDSPKFFRYAGWNAERLCWRECGEESDELEGWW
jgi:hypothetical protein